MIQLESSMETHKMCLGTFDMCSISHTANVVRDIRILPMYTATVTHRHLLWLVKYANEETVGSVLHIPIGRSRME
jgi:hypothetical protein